MNGEAGQAGAIRVLGTLAGLMIAPVATPALIWVTVATDLPLAVVIPQLAVMATISHWLSRITVGAWRPVENGVDDRTG
jgi:hypothetical protein